MMCVGLGLKKRGRTVERVASRHGARVPGPASSDLTAQSHAITGQSHLIDARSDGRCGRGSAYGDAHHTPEAPARASESRPDVGVWVGCGQAPGAQFHKYNAHV
jgi:hypothetical protein